MLTIRAIDDGELDAFSRLDPSTPDVATTIGELWADGSGRPDWTLVADEGGRLVGRVALYAEDLGCGLPIREGRLSGLWVDRRTDAAAASVRALLDRASELARGEMPFIERRLNAEGDQDIGFWQAALAAAGFGLFQEKRGFVWTDASQVLPEPERLEFRSVRQIGVDAYAAAMAASILGTLDRNDQFYLALCGADGWGREMVGVLEPGDEDAWLVAREPDGTLAGYVAVGAFEDGVGTIVHIGVAPPCRGRGYVDELLRAANRSSRERGYRSVLSDVDVANFPMLAAMERNDHRPGVRPWHVWSYRRQIPAR